jgi:hypothetical protein
MGGIGASASVAAQKEENMRKFLVFCLACMCLSLVSASAWAYVVLNPGFEDAALPNGVGTSWTAYTMGGTVTYGLAAGVKHSGAKSQRIDLVSSGYSEGGVYQVIAVNPAAPLTISVWANIGTLDTHVTAGLGVSLSSWGTDYLDPTKVWWGPETGVTGTGSSYFVQLTQTLSVEDLGGSTEVGIFLNAYKTEGTVTEYARFDDVLAVPEPGGIVALLGGLVGLAGMIRRRA